ncbi:alkaline phosphatase family protein [Leptothoe spongobia]|uniref:Alkaline phosphatase family protein n=1 Tax=Leptothoe spongobia TAU-MAC 1115 TaxID=1967444 RepID=A0A947DAP6_9CYAN|nr:alkaline phosphatase family protein [Leptothoe spongobia]MBT9313965.1 alkaline phosphatase family protein [Leptothoe spongobia TAU-MAC 1115]
MRNPVIAIGLDAADPNLLDQWMAAGKLKNLSRLRQQGAYGHLSNTVNYNQTVTETSATERLWVMFGTGCQPDKTGYWSPIRYSVNDYSISHDTVDGAYDFNEYPPFYALGKDYKVAAFDVPVSRLSEDVHGMQILGWGGHAPHTPSHSQPPELFPQLIEHYGKNPILHQDYGCWWDTAYVQRIKSGLNSSIATRAKICQDLLTQEPWDLFLTVFGESHTASHDLWHLSQSDNPLYPYKSGPDDPMLTAFEAMDQAIGDIVAAAPDHANIIIFSVHGMGNNVTDMYSMAFLPELLYRHSFPGKYGIAKGNIGGPCPPMRVNPKRKSWSGEVWQQRYDSNPIKRLLMPWIPSKFDHYLNGGPTPALASPYELRKQGVALNWMPAMWYSPLWAQMKAFALPAFAAGHIRINLKGREAQGIVDVADYDDVCDQITQSLYQLKHGRTGQPIVKDVVRTRSQTNAISCQAQLPDADLVVIWHDQPSDVIDSPEFGRIGPLTYYRSGGHRSDGFLLAKGPNIKPASTIDHARTVDIGPTIRELMGASALYPCDGHSLFSPSTSAKA